MKRFIASMLCLIILLSMGSGLVDAQGFSDVKSGDWFRDDVLSLTDLGIVKGYADGSFKPNNNVHRDEFMKMVVVSLGYDVGNASGYWATDYIEKAYNLNLISNSIYKEMLSDRSYASDTMTRAEMAGIVARAIEDEVDDSWSSYDLYVNDYNTIGVAFREGVLKSYQLGVITGYPDGDFKPYNGATRAEAATMIIRMLYSNRRKTKIVTHFDADYLLGKWELDTFNNNKLDIVSTLEYDGSQVIENHDGNIGSFSYEVNYEKYTINNIPYKILVLTENQFIFEDDTRRFSFVKISDGLAESSEYIGTSGGSVELTEKTKVEFVNGGLSQGSQVTIEELADSEMASVYASYFSNAGKNVEITLEGGELEAAAYVTLEYDASASPSELVVLHFDESGGYEVLEGLVNTSNRTITVQTESFSPFGVYETSESFRDEMNHGDPDVEFMNTGTVFDMSSSIDGLESYDDNKMWFQTDYWGIVNDPTGSNMGGVAYCAAVHNGRYTGRNRGYEENMRSALEFHYDNSDPQIKAAVVEFDLYVDTLSGIGLNKTDYFVLQIKPSAYDAWTNVTPVGASGPFFTETNGWQHMKYNLHDYSSMSGIGSFVNYFGNTGYPDIEIRLVFVSKGDDTPVYADGVYGAYVDNLEMNVGYGSPNNVTFDDINISSISIENNIKLDWNDVAEADGYMVERAVGTGDFEVAAVVEDSEKSFTEEATGDTYYYRVRAYKKILVVGTMSFETLAYSDYSDVVEFDSETNEIDIAGFSYSASDSAAVIFWDELDSNIDVELEKKIDNGAFESLKDYVKTTPSTIIDYDIEDGHVYTYRLIVYMNSQTYYSQTISGTTNYSTGEEETEDPIEDNGNSDVDTNIDSSILENLKAYLQNELKCSIYEIIGLSDGNYAAVGYTYSEDNGLLVKVSPDGDIIFVNEYEVIDGVFQDVIEGNNNRIIASGSKRLSTNNPYIRDIWAVGVDGEGDTLWDKQYSSDDIFNDCQKIIKGIDGKYVLVGRNGTHALLFKIDENGSLIWQVAAEILDDAGGDISYINDAIVDKDGNIITCGSSQLGGTAEISHAFGLKVSNGGMVRWVKFFGGEKKDYFSNVEIDSDGHYVFSSPYAGWYVTTDQDGNLLSEIK